jgi:hypothetical protein
MNLRVVIGILALRPVVGRSWTVSTVAHQDPSRRLHTCSSDHNTYICGGLGSYDHGMDTSQPYIGRRVCQ